MNNTIFVTGINTEVGKTIASAVITEALQADYWKPIQSGELDHTDSQKVAKLISNSKTYIHPEAFRFQAPESPHFAAKLEGMSITNANFSFPKTENFLVIEGAGGICVPINEEEFFIDVLPKDTAILLVSKNELGSINATLLSLYFLESQGFGNVGLWFNGDEKPSTESVIHKKTQVQVLGRMEWTQSLDQKFIQQQAALFKKPLENWLQKHEIS